MDSSIKHGVGDQFIKVKLSSPKICIEPIKNVSAHQVCGCTLRTGGAADVIRDVVTA